MGTPEHSCASTVAVQGSSCARSASWISALVFSTRALPLTMTLQPSDTLWSSASNATRLFITTVNSLVPSAVRESTVLRCTTKLT